MGHDWECDCGEDWGPCENHMDVIAQREGASTRTADDLVFVFLGDVLAAAEDPEIRQGAEVDTARLRDSLTYWEEESRWDDNMGCRWVSEDESAEIHEEMSVGESVLADLGLSVTWDDGYVIYRIHADCPLIV